MIITFSPNPPEEDRNFLTEGLHRQAAFKKELPSPQHFAYFLKDENGKIQGGITAMCYYGCLHIRELYINPAYQGQDWGTKLMAAAESHGRAQHCTMFTLCTMDWQARGFYEKLGYAVEFTRSGYEKGSSLYYMRKN